MQKNMFDVTGLSDWLKETFSKDEIDLFKTKLPEYFDGSFIKEDMNPADLLSTVLSYYNTKEHSETCIKLCRKIEELLKGSKDFETKHFALMPVMKCYYKNDLLEDAERICKYCVDFSPLALKSIKENPLMSGAIGTNPYYDQLAIIYKKRKEWHKVIALCEKGKNEGWQNDFDKRIEEAKSKI